VSRDAPSTPTPAEPLPQASGPNRKLLLAAMLAGVTLLHMATPTVGSWVHAAHVFYRKLYFVPIVAGALWYGMRGALAMTAASIGLYMVHVQLNWLPEPYERIDQFGEMGSFLILGITSGVLVALERRARARAERIRTRAERERIGTAVATLTETLGARDPVTLEHSLRVARLAEGFATHLGLPRADVRSLYLAAVVHDIGKVGIRDDVLLKPETLNPAERRMIMEHPRIAARILAPIGFEKVVSYVVAHHENVDGSGYPDGLAGEEIPLPARILTIADTYDALSHERPYKRPLSPKAVRRIMERMAGKKLDADLLRRFWEHLDSRSAEAPPARRTARTPTVTPAGRSA